MINGIIKLFYSEVVKTKMKQMPTSQYEIRDEFKEIHSITLKVDSVLFKVIKFIIGVTILLLAININLFLGIGILLIETLYIIYKRNLEKETLEYIEGIKNNINTNLDSYKIKLISEKGKTGLNMLITLLIIGLILDFNLWIILSFIIVFVFTMKDIYSNIK